MNINWFLVTSDRNSSYSELLHDRYLLSINLLLVASFNTYCLNFLQSFHIYFISTHYLFSLIILYANFLITAFYILHRLIAWCNFLQISINLLIGAISFPSLLTYCLVQPFSHYSYQLIVWYYPVHLLHRLIVLYVACHRVKFLYITLFLVELT